VFTTTLATVIKEEGSYLHDLFSGRMNIILDRNNLPFIDRDGEYFGYVLDYLRDGEVQLPHDVMIAEIIEKEFEFYRIKIMPKITEWKFGELRTSDVKLCERNLAVTNTSNKFEFVIGNKLIELPLETFSYS